MLPVYLDNTGIRDLSRNFRHSFLFTATCNNSPSARRVLATKNVCRDVDIFRKLIISLK